MTSTLTINQFDESSIVESRLEDICPKVRFSEMDIDEVERATRVAFKIIGFLPQNFSDAFRKSWESFEGEMLWEFIYGVWCNEQR